MKSENQNNGNSQLNGVREDSNNKVNKLSLLGKTKRVAWNSNRRNRSI